MPNKTKIETRGIAATGRIYRPKSGSGHYMTDFVTVVTKDKFDHVLVLGPDLNRAQLLAAEARAKIRNGESIREVQTWLALQLARTSGAGGVATLAEIVAYDFKGDIGIKPRVLQAYRRSALKVLETVLLCERGLPPKNHTGRKPNERVTAADYPLTTGVPLTRFDGVLAHKYVEFKLRGFTPGTREYDSARKSAYADLQSAAALFQPKLMAEYRRLLNVPVMDSFRGAAWVRPAVQHPIIPPDHRLVAAHADVDSLARVDESWFLAASLALHAGLARAESVEAHASWLRDVNGPALMVVCDGRSREVPISDALFGRLKARGEGYFLEGCRSRRARHCAAAAQFMRARGSVGIRWPLEELRTFYTWFVISTMPPMVAMHVLGHVWFGTTNQFLDKGNLSPAMIALWRRPMPLRRAA